MQVDRKPDGNDFAAALAAELGLTVHLCGTKADGSPF